MISIGICDEDAEFYSYLLKLLTKAGLDSKGCMFYYYSSEKDFFRYMQSTAFNLDLLFLNVSMREVLLDLTEKAFRIYDTNSLVLVYTQPCDCSYYNLEGHPYISIDKDETEEVLIQALSPVIRSVRSKIKPPVVICSQRMSTRRVEAENIMYIRLAKRGSLIQLNTEEIEGKKLQLLCKDSVWQLYERLRDYGFEYAHNSFIVNMKYIQCRNATEVVLTDGTILPIARSKEKQFKISYSTYLITNKSI
jgi:hypothetical protein